MATMRSAEGPERFYSPSLDALWERLGSRPEPRRALLEHVYLDTGHPSLFYTGFARGRRAVADEVPPFGEGAPYRVEHRASDAAPIVRDARSAQLGDIASLVPRALGDLHPVFGVRFERLRYEHDHACIEVDLDATYYSLSGDAPFRLGAETVPRIAARAAGKRKDDKRLAAWLDGLSRAPHTTKKWMGFHFVKACYEVPRYDELLGWEYEFKLDVDSLDVDVGRLPFPVLEVLQSDSVRGYYPGRRACVRGASAHIVEKGPVDEIDGVLRRPERKRRGLAAWDLPAPPMAMRRYKREINVLNPDSGRVYTLSLHHCVAGSTFDQLEIEYDGRLVPGAVPEMARFKRDHDTGRLLALAEQAARLGWDGVAHELRDRHRRLTPGAPEVGPSPAERHAPAPDPAIERAVVDDILLLVAGLAGRAGCRPSRLTKRKWLKAVHGARG